MKFVIDEVDINFDRLELNTCYNWRFRGRIGPRFYFTTDKFISMSLIAKLKYNNNFMAMLKDKCSEAIEQMSDEDFIRLQDSIRNAINPNYSRNQANKMHLLYSNSVTKDSNGVSRIYFVDDLSNYHTVPESRLGVIQALMRTNSKDVRKE